MKYFFFLSFCCLLIVTSCTQDKKTNQSTAKIDENTKQFESISPQESRVLFTNQVDESAVLNFMVYEGVYQGAGVGILDANADGLMDIYFAGNAVPDKLYLNQGDFKFQDATILAGIPHDKNWSTGVSVVDINADGYDDIYICKYLYDDVNRRKNVLLINDGSGKFENQAAKFGLDDSGYSIMSNFFDYDLDGDLDVYICNQPPNSFLEKAQLDGKIDYNYTDRLYQNQGDGTFKDVTESAGMISYGYSLSATMLDFNNDSWPDLYVASDYEEADMLYENNGDGTFTNIIDKAMKHIPNFSMGADAADINNDGLMDLFVSDMTAEDNFRIKTNMSGMNPERFWGLANAGYHYQYMFNAMQLNNGNGKFSEIAQMSGISSTDWSWSTLFVDFDQNGWKDLLVTNGIPKEMRNKDFEIKRKELINSVKEKAASSGSQNVSINPLDITALAPSVKVPNYVFKNNGDLTFSKVQEEWNLDRPSWSQGAAYADFDNDGDMDLVLNNINEVAEILKNNANEKDIGNYIKIDLIGNAQNPKGIGAKISIEYGDQIQTWDVNPSRGYMSTSSSSTHFGLGQYDNIDKITVVWAGGATTERANVKANQKISISKENANNNRRDQENQVLFTESYSHQIEHIENDFDDYAREILLPHKLSTLGPVLAKGDVNNDGLEDLYLGGSVNSPGQLFQLTEAGQLELIPNNVFMQHKNSEDSGASFFDADQDGDLDLIVSSGGNENPANSNAFLDRLYLNDGTGKFRYKQFSNDKISSSVVCPIDYNDDGKMDIFIGGRYIPGQYGYPSTSLLYQNMGNGNFEKINIENWEGLGMVTDAKWADLDGDQQKELIIVGEWMPISVWKWNNSTFEKAAFASLENTNGWWNCVALADIDGDDDLDIIAGNLGLNIKYKASLEEPFRLYANDFDDNGTNDVYLAYYEAGTSYPVRGRQCSSEQMPFVKNQFKTYESFANASVEEVLEGRMDGSFLNEVHTFENSVFINESPGVFRTKELPNYAQIAPIFSIIVDDINEDGFMDLLTFGNYYNREVETTRSDAGSGLILLGTAQGDFVACGPSCSGITADNDVRAALMLNNKAGKMLSIANNNAAMQFYNLNK